MGGFDYYTSPCLLELMDKKSEGKIGRIGAGNSLAARLGPGLSFEVRQTLSVSV